MTGDYPLFVHWYKTVDWILSTVERFPKNARFSMASRMADACLDTLMLIIDAIYRKDRLTVLDEINLLLEKQRVLFRLSFERRYISTRQYEFIAASIDEAGRMTGGWRNKVLEKNK